jgi:endogenous inhibitor of DNA gyrase (YacG/DUF329 family)
MKPLTSSELLSVWEHCRSRSLLDKALQLLQTACSDGEPEDPALLSIGDRDGQLLQLREWMFGSQLSSVSDCPQCGAQIEWITDIADLRFPAEGKTTASSFSLQADPFQIQFRLPNSYDLFKAASDSDYQANPKKLLAACILEVQKESSQFQAEDLPDEVLTKVDQQMAMEDPQADIAMRLNCPECAHTWQAQFDIVSYLWIEIDSWASHTLLDVAVLAATFGWSESQILSLSPQRRQLYLDIIRK